MRVDLSIIVPVYNEQENVLPLWQEVAAAMASAELAWELVFVDDGSTDETWNRIREARGQDPRVRGLRHKKNAGQSAAVWTGLVSSSSAFVATLDGDRQNDPADIPWMLSLLQKDNLDFISGMRLKRQDNWLRRVSSAVARWVRNVVLNTNFRDTGCALRVFKRTVLDGIPAFNGLHRFLPVLVAGAGWKTREVEVRHRQRVAGVSKYGVWNRLFRGIYDLVGVGWFQRRRIPRVQVETIE
ncbi:MAG: glycosyltransferase family 2 protein [Verrucomicrobiota bacterium]|nr:glycosyltransferase family 2 protein [Verrucomicrobiota bacterium]